MQATWDTHHAQNTAQTRLRMRGVPVAAGGRCRRRAEASRRRSARRSTDQASRQCPVTLCQLVQ